jgi:tripartite-type tricarboxylate transporter receptor subunit TctC
MFVKSAVAALSAAAILGASASYAPAQAQSNYYEGKTVTILVGFGAGGMYGVYARLMARHLAKHIPGNPTIGVQHMPGQGGAKMANYAYNAAPKDGSYLLELSKDIAVSQRLRPKASKYKADKFTYFGRIYPYSAVLMVWHTAGVSNLADARKKQVILAASGKSSHAYMEAKLMEKFGGVNFKIVLGYRGAGDMYKAMEAGEAHARIGAWISLKSVKRAWLESGKAKVVVQTGLKRAPDLPDVPAIMELGKTAEQKKMFEFMSLGGPVGWGLSAPPGVPADRNAIIGKAMTAMLKDPEFIADLKKRNAGFDPASGAEVTAAIKKTLAVPEAMITKMRKVAGF